MERERQKAKIEAQTFTLAHYNFGGYKKHPLLILGHTFSWYYNAIVGTIMQLSVLSSKIQGLQHWGRKK